MGIVLVFRVRVSLKKLDDGAHKYNVHVDIDISATRYRIARLKDKSLEVGIKVDWQVKLPRQSERVAGQKKC